MHEDLRRFDVWEVLADLEIPIGRNEKEARRLMNSVLITMPDPTKPRLVLIWKGDSIVSAAAPFEEGHCLVMAIRKVASRGSQVAAGVPDCATVGRFDHK